MSSAAFRDGPGEYSDRYIAFLDLMGFETIVDESVSDRNAFMVARDALGTLNDHREFSQLMAGNDPATDPWPKLYMFSDSMLISSPVSESGLKELVDLVARICGSLVMRAVFVRGGIVRGKLLEHEQMVFGPGLIDAYKLESKVARYPRILVSSEVVEAARSVNYDVGGRDTMPLSRRFRRDVDAFGYVDWLCHFHKIYEPGTKGFRTDSPLDFALIKKSIEWSLNEYSGQPDVYAKICWFANYFNEVISQGKDLNILGSNRNMALIEI